MKVSKVMLEASLSSLVCKFLLYIKAKVVRMCYFCFFSMLNILYYNKIGEMSKKIKNHKIKMCKNLVQKNTFMIYYQMYKCM